jgi:hypothetical protein
MGKTFKDVRDRRVPAFRNRKHVFRDDQTMEERVLVQKYSKAWIDDVDVNDQDFGPKDIPELDTEE